MPHESIELLKREIADLRNRTAVRLKALRELELAEAIAPSEPEQNGISQAGVEFVNMAPISAIEKLLTRTKEPLPPNEIIRALMQEAPV